MGKSYGDIDHSPPQVTGNILKTILRFASYYLLITANSTFMTDSQCLGPIYNSHNLNEPLLTSTKSAIC